MNHIDAQLMMLRWDYKTADPIRQGILTREAERLKAKKTLGTNNDIAKRQQRALEIAEELRQKRLQNDDKIQQQGGGDKKTT